MILIFSNFTYRREAYLETVLFCHFQISKQVLCFLSWLTMKTKSIFRNTYPNQEEMEKILTGHLIQQCSRANPLSKIPNPNGRVFDFLFIYYIRISALLKEEIKISFTSNIYIYIRNIFYFFFNYKGKTKKPTLNILQKKNRGSTFNLAITCTQHKNELASIHDM